MELKQKGKSSCDKLLSKLISVDQFGEPLNMVYPGDELNHKYQSLLGGVFTIFALTFTMMVAVWSFKVKFIDFQDTIIIQATEFEYFDHTMITNYTNKFKVAYTFYEAYSGQTGNPIYELDETIGQVKVYQEIWNSTNYEQIEVPVRNCDESDFAHDESPEFEEDSQSKFFKPSGENQHSNLEVFKCIDDEFANIAGHYNSDAGSNLMLAVERCQNDNEKGIVCQTEE